MSVGGHALPTHPLILKWLHPPPPTHTQTHTTTTTTPVVPYSPVSSTVCGDEVWEFRSVLLSNVYNVLWPYMHLSFTNNLSFGLLSLLRYMVCVCALIRSKIRNKSLVSCIFIQFCLDQLGTKLSWQTDNTQPLTVPVAFVLNQLVLFWDFSFQNKKENNRSATEVW